MDVESTPKDVNEKGASWDMDTAGREIHNYFQCAPNRIL